MITTTTTTSIIAHSIILMNVIVIAIISVIAIVAMTATTITWRKTKVVLVKVVSWIIDYFNIRFYICVMKLMVRIEIYIIQENHI